MAYLPAGGKELAVTGTAGIMGVATQSLITFAIVIVVSGVVLKLWALAPRIAFEAVRDDQTGSRRYRFTRNGKAITWRRAKR